MWLGAMDRTDNIGFSAEEILTSEPTRSARLKWVVVVDETLSPGLMVKRCCLRRRDHRLACRRSHSHRRHRRLWEGTPRVALGWLLNTGCVTRCARRDPSNGSRSRRRPGRRHAGSGPERHRIYDDTSASSRPQRPRTWVSMPPASSDHATGSTNSSNGFPSCPERRAD